MTTTIRAADLIDSVANALQFISYYHPKDFIDAMYAAWQREQNPAAKDAMAQILINSRLCAIGKRPLCQDTGIVTVFITIGMNVRFDTDTAIDDLINEGVRRAYTYPDNVLRASILEDPDGARRNTRDNTPAVIHHRLVPGDTITLQLAAKGGGSEAKARFAMLNPADNVADWVMAQLPGMGAGWCPPGMLGIGIGGTAEQAMLMAKQSLMAPVDIQTLEERARHVPDSLSHEDRLRLELFTRANQSGIGAQGLGGLTTVLDVKVRSAPTHAANKPVALIPNCAATRHIDITLDGTGPAQLPVPSLEDWPEIARTASDDTLHVDLDTVTADDIAHWQPGQTLLISGHLLTGRDAAHKRLVDLLEQGAPLPIDLHDRFIYYVGPVDPVRDEVVGPAGPTTATRMDRFTRPLLEQAGLRGMIGKAERGKNAIQAIKDNQAVYLMAVGGAAYLVAQAITAARVVAFEDLGMEAIYEFTVKDMPVTVAVDTQGHSIHALGPQKWHDYIAAH
ncbi:fumarate hydratase [Zymobacter palmae]|uniref:Fumarate hydratase class I n=1 Tax=Zymobacter palmae TaxID=33074 RepID=A0A348HEF6_9GAMM|nr:fumarate hydratase [Zymobacter palmae]BBG30008.1 tartrate dehydratase alpha subunit/Fumarate [Zymobacter palmae]